MQYFAWKFINSSKLDLNLKNVSVQNVEVVNSF